MKRALTEASLILKPEAYSDGTLQSVKPLDGSGDFTFTRGSNLAATRVNKDGLIEKGRENLLLHSNQFDTTWGTIDSEATIGQIGYDGSNNAWLVSKTDLNGRVQQNIVTSGVQTFSVYVKAGTKNWVALRVDGSGVNTYFDLQNGVVGSTSNTIEANIKSLSNDWHRCSVALSSGITRVRIYVADGDNDTSGTSGSIYIQDAQLELGLVATDYIETGATTAKAGVLEDTPRLDYSGGATEPSLLLEPQRTNFFNQSEYFEEYTSIVGATITTNTTETLSPEGLYNATKIEGTGSWTIRQSIASLQNVETTTSFWVKAVDPNANNKFKIRSHSDDSSTIFTATSEWVRYDHTYTGTGSYFGIADNGNTDANLYIYGFQVEEDSYPTSYMPTYGTSVTRGGDDATASNVINADSDFTFYFESNKIPDDAGRYLEFTGNLGYLSSYVSSRIRWRYLNSNLSALISEGTFKFLIRKDSVDIKMYLNGELQYTRAVPSSLQGFNLEEGSVHKTLIFPTALSDAECIKLTTL